MSINTIMGTGLSALSANQQALKVVSTNVAEGYNLGHLVAQVQAKVDPIVHKYGYAVTYGGQFEAQQSAAKTIYVMGAGVAVVILILLYIALVLKPFGLKFPPSKR